MSRSIFLMSFLVITRSILSLNDEYSTGEWRKTLEVCWTDSSCSRVMNVVHGGDWDLNYPYDSLPAFQQANYKGADAVKGDLRVTKGFVSVCECFLCVVSKLFLCSLCLCL